MKTQIITLESHDDLISVRDRLSWAKTPRILLVWPKYEKVTLRQVDLKVLQRHASSLGAQLALVTRTRHVREDAEALRIPVFESTGEAQRVAWPEVPRKRLPHHAPDKSLREKRNQLPGKEEAWRSLPFVRLAAFAVGVLSVLVIAALFIPRAQIVLTPISKTQSVILPVIANPAADSIVITGTIPAREITLTVDGTQTVIVTGEGVIPQSKAKGVVTFRNLTQQAVTIPAGTVLQAGSISFITTEAGEMKAGVGKTLDLPVEAVEGGVAGNLDAEKTNAIEGRLGLSLSVTNPEPTTGGREHSSVQASDADRKRAKDLLMGMLDEKARQQFVNEIGSGDLLFENTIHVSQILTEQFDLPSGAVGTKLTLTMKVEYSARYASASDLTKLASLALNASLPPGFSTASEGVTIKPVQNPTITEDGSAHWTMRAERVITQQINPAQVVSLIEGQSVGAAQSMLKKSLPLARSAEFRLSPSWWPWMPIVPFRIEVVTQ